MMKRWDLIFAALALLFGVAAYFLDTWWGFAFSGAYCGAVGAYYLVRAILETVHPQ